jgi:hypothetical protein
MYEGVSFCILSPTLVFFIFWLTAILLAIDSYLTVVLSYIFFKTKFWSRSCKKEIRTTQLLGELIMTLRTATLGWPWPVNHRIGCDFGHGSGLDVIQDRSFL